MVTEHSYITYGNSIRVYVNPFKDCPTAEKLFHGIGLVLQGRINPYMYSKLPYIVGTEKLPEGTLEEGNEHPDAMTFNVIHEKGKQLLYKDARSCYIHLRKLNPQLLPLPAKKLDIIEGLQEIQDCCTDLASRKNDSEWSKPMSKSKMMSALGIDSYETFNAFANRHGIREINRKTFQICLDKMSNKEKDKLIKA